MRKVKQKARVKKRGGLWIVEISGPRGWIVGGEWKTKREAEADAKIYRSNPVARKKRRTAKQIAATKKLVAFNKKRRGKKKVTRKRARRTVVRKKATRRRNPARKRAATRTTDYVVFRCIPGRSAVTYLKAISPSGGTVAWTGERFESLHWTKRSVAEKWARKLAANRRTMVGVAGAGTSKAAIAAKCRDAGK